MNSIRKLIIGFGFKFGSIFLSFLLSITVANIYGLENIAVVSFASMLGTMLLNLSGFGMQAGLVKLVAVTRALEQSVQLKDIERSANYLRLIGLFIVLISFFVGYKLDFLQTPQNLNEQYFLILAFGWVVNVWSQTFLYGLKGMKYNNLAFLLNNLCLPIGGFIGVLLAIILDSHDFFIFVACLAGTHCIIALLTWFSWVHYRVTASRSTPTKNLPCDHQILNQPKLQIVFKYCIPFFVPAIFGIYFKFIDRLYLSMYATATEFGAYDIIWKLASLVITVELVLSSYMLPRLSELFAISKNHAALIKTTREYSFISVLLGSVVTLSILFFSTPLLGLWDVGLESYEALLLLIVAANCISVCLGPVSVLLLASDYVKVRNYILMSSAILLTPLGFMLVSSYGIHGAAMLAFLSVTLVKVSCWLAVRYLFGSWVFPIVKLPKLA